MDGHSSAINCWRYHSPCRYTHAFPCASAGNRSSRSTTPASSTHASVSLRGKSTNRIRHSPYSFANDPTNPCTLAPLAPLASTRSASLTATLCHVTTLNPSARRPYPTRNNALITRYNKSTPVSCDSITPSSSNPSLPAGATPAGATQYTCSTSPTSLNPAASASIELAAVTRSTCSCG